MKGLKKKIDSIKPQFEKGGRFSKLQSVFDGFYTFLYTPNETSASGVHIHDSNDSKRTMITVVIALLPCCLFGMWNIGLQHFMATGNPSREFFSLFFYGFLAVLPQILTAYVVGLGIEFIVAQIRGHEIQEGFLVSGILIPMICPVDTPCWMIAVAVAFAVIFAKEVFGGTGYNFLNIALVTRAFLFFSYPSKMSGDNVFVSLGGDKAVDSYSGATPLGQIASSTELGAAVTNIVGDPLSFGDIFMGYYPGSWGETSTLCILIGGAILLLTGIANWRIILSALCGGLLMSAVAHNWASPLYPATYLDPITQICFGGFLFAIHGHRPRDRMPHHCGEIYLRIPHRRHRDHHTLLQHRIPRRSDAGSAAHELLRPADRLVRGQQQYPPAHETTDSKELLTSRTL